MTEHNWMLEELMEMWEDLGKTELVAAGVQRKLRHLIWLFLKSGVFGREIDPDEVMSDRYWNS